MEVARRTDAAVGGLVDCVQALPRPGTLGAAWLEAFENRDPALIKKGSIRRRRKEALIAERREEVAGLVAGLQRVEDEMLNRRRLGERWYSSDRM